MSEQDFPSVERVMHYVITSMAELGPAGTELSLDEIYNKTIRSLLEERKITVDQLEVRGAQNRLKIKRIIWTALDRLRKVDRVRNLPGKNNNVSAIWVLKSSNKLSLSEEEAKRLSEEANKLTDDSEDERDTVQDAAPAWPEHSFDAKTTNVILYGPPGTGKTFRTTARAVKLARGNVSEDTNNASDANDAALRAEYKRLVAAGQIVFVTFHQSYGYEEFVEGIRPETTDDGQVSYDVRWGALRRIADAAQRALVLVQRTESQLAADIDWNTTKQYVMIIDEINRGNMSRIFGELITLLEPSKRLGASDELIVRLPASGDDFGLPPNLHFIGTMNTADRSIALLDVALRRRFRFEELMPDPKLVKDSPNGARLMTALNKRIAILLDREHQLGHALFMRAKDDAGLVGVLQKDVLPLLKEYFYGDWERIAAVLMCSGADKSKDDKTTNGALVYKETINDHELPKGLVEQGAASMWCELSFEEAEKVAGAIIARVIGATK